MFGVKDIQKEYEQLVKLGVKFTMEPTEMGEVTIAVFDDTSAILFRSLSRTHDENVMYEKL